jgi:hypothetical protein
MRQLCRKRRLPVLSRRRTMLHLEGPDEHLRIALHRSGREDDQPHSSALTTPELLRSLEGRLSPTTRQTSFLRVRCCLWWSGERPTRRGSVPTSTRLFAVDDARRYLDLRPLFVGEAASPDRGASRRVRSDETRAGDDHGRWRPSAWLRCLGRLSTPLTAVEDVRERACTNQLTASAIQAPDQHDNSPHRDPR